MGIHSDVQKADEEKRMEHWKKVCQEPLYQFLKHGEGHRIMELLFDQKISIGKAAESIVEKFYYGVEPVLPETEEERRERMKIAAQMSKL